MRRRQNILLAGIAALALVAGTGLSLAQQNQPSQTGGTQGTAQNQGATTSPSKAGGSAMQHRGSNAGTTAQTNSSGAGNQSSTGQQNAQQNMGQKNTAHQNMAHQNMQRQNMGQNGAQQSAGQNSARAGNRSAEKAEQGRMGHVRHGHMNRTAEINEGRHGATIRSQRERGLAIEERGRSHMNVAQDYRYGERNRISTAQRHLRGERTQVNAAQERNGSLRGLQANTSVPMGRGSVNLTEQQRSQIRDRVIFAGGAPRVDNVDFNVRVGSAVPRGHLHAVRVPETLVQIDPQWRGYYYFIYHDQVVVVSPRTMRIVAVMPA